MRLRNRTVAGRPALGFPALAVAGAAVVIGGCESYLDRRDTVSRVAGNAVAYNRVAQTVDRWPQASRSDHWRSDGERARVSVDRYRKREIGEDKKSEDKSAVSTQGGATTTK